MSGAGKPNCYKCIHRRSIPGDAHSSCRHPSISDISSNPMTRLLEALGGGAPVGADRLGVTGHPHGIRCGWFGWPANFDPVWLITCNGFEARDAAEEEDA